MGIKLKTIGLSITTVALALLINTAAFGAPVDIEYLDAGTSASLDIKHGGTVTAGLHRVTLNDSNRFALNTTNSDMMGDWSATATSFDEIQAGGGEYGDTGKHMKKQAEKYGGAGYLFSLLDVSESLSADAAKYNALINYVIWDILGSHPKLNDDNDKLEATNLKDLAKDNKKFDWSSTMVVYTANDGSAREFFAVLPPIATPIPSALFLFGSMALGLFGIVRRKETASA
jgi:hypothetical protein|tara:strand:+ start:297 stop:986 length:690 start_codon:yes stop_codon:yes gene_type:complete